MPRTPHTGAITDTAPFRWGRRPADPVSVCYLQIPWLLYVHYGDKYTLRKHYAGMKAWVDFLTGCAQDGIIPYSYYGDWAPPVHLGISGSQGSSAVSRDTPGELVSTACYAFSLDLLGRIAGVLEREEEHAAYAALAEQVRQAYHRRFWDEAVGGYGSNNQSCNAISLYMDMVPPECTPRVVANLVRDVVELNDCHLTTGNICTKYLLEALTAAGHGGVAYSIANQETYPSWGYMLANGATTLWERWELATGSGMNSHNHPMLGSVGSWLYRAIGGIRADEEGPGFAAFEVRPHIDPRLQHARLHAPDGARGGWLGLAGRRRQAAAGGPRPGRQHCAHILACAAGGHSAGVKHSGLGRGACRYAHGRHPRVRAPRRRCSCAPWVRANITLRQRCRSGD